MTVNRGAAQMLPQKRKATDKDMNEKIKKRLTPKIDVKLRGGTPANERRSPIRSARASKDDGVSKMLSLDDESTLITKQYVPPIEWPVTIYSYAAGLHNPNHLCYRRATLQAFLHLPCLLHYLWDNEKLCKEFHGPTVYCQICRIAFLASSMWNSDPNFVNYIVGQFDQYIYSSAVWREDADQILTQESPQSSHVIQGCEWMLGEQQEDALDFLYWFVNLFICDAVFGASAKKMFQINLVGVWQCATCRTFYDGRDEFDTGLILSIEAPLGESLDNYIHQYFEALRMNGVCTQRGCASLGHATSVDRCQRIVHAPQVLFLNLRRATEGFRKNHKRIKYPFSLDLGRYTHIRRFKGTATYKLSSVVCHRGATVWEGHYIAYVMGKDVERQRYDVPIRYNDQEVQEVTLSEMLCPREGFDPYILVYVRQHPYEGDVMIPSAAIGWPNPPPLRPGPSRSSSEQALHNLLSTLNQRQTHQVYESLSRAIQRNSQPESVLKSRPQEIARSQPQVSNEPSRKAPTPTKGKLIGRQASRGVSQSSEQQHPRAKHQTTPPKSPARKPSPKPTQPSPPRRSPQSQHHSTRGAFKPARRPETRQYKREDRQHSTLSENEARSSSGTSTKEGRLKALKATTSVAGEIVEDDFVNVAETDYGAEYDYLLSEQEIGEPAADEEQGNDENAEEEGEECVEEEEGEECVEEEEGEECVEEEEEDELNTGG